MAFFIGFCQTTIAQKEAVLLEAEKRYAKEYDPLIPARAAFYSAILPGLGQAYNKKYWKIPIVYTALGLGTFAYIDNRNEFHRFRDAFKDRLAGRPDEFTVNGVEIASTQGLIRAQQTFRRNMETSLLITIGIYVLQIIDANVDGHLRQYDVSRDLSFEPVMYVDPLTNTTQMGMSLNLRF